jgi:hypothetical protein
VGARGPAPPAPRRARDSRKKVPRVAPAARAAWYNEQVQTTPLLPAADPRLTDHARARAAEMGVRTKEVKLCMREPELLYESGPRYCGVVACRGRIAVPFVVRADGTAVALTVLWHGSVFERPPSPE